MYLVTKNIACSRRSDSGWRAKNNLPQSPLVFSRSFARPPLSERLEQATKNTDRVYSIFNGILVCGLVIWGKARARGGGVVLVIVCILTSLVQLTTTWRLERGGQSLGAVTEEHVLKLSKNKEEIEIPFQIQL